MTVVMNMNVDIHCPVEEVFQAMSDIRTQPQWDPDLLEGRHIPDGAPGLGTELVEVRKFMGRVSENSSEYVEFEPNKSFIRYGDNGPLALTGRIQFKPNGDQTSVSWQWELQLKGLLRIFEPLMEPMMQKQAQSILVNLKQLLESGAFEPL